MSPTLPPGIRSARLDDLPDIEALLKACALPTDGVAHLLRSTPEQFLVARNETGMLVAVDGVEGRCVALYLLTTTAEHYFPRFSFVRIEREHVPDDSAGTVEFTSACPASAVVMVRYRNGTVP